MRSYFRVLLAVGLLAACGGDDDDDDVITPDAAPSGPSAIAVYEPGTPGAGADWGTLPFPSDLFLDGEGRLTLTSLPTGQSPDTEMVQYMKDTLHDLNGAGVWSSVYFPIDGDIDPDTLAGNVVLIDLDGGGAEIPVDLRWRADVGAIIAVPQRGRILLEARQYAAYVTDGVRAADGGDVGRSQAFDAAIESADAHLAPLVAALDAATIDSLVVATVFTTADVTPELKAMRDIVAATAPTVTVVDVWGPDAAELDQIFGAQDPAATPGFTHGGFRGQPHGSVAVVIHGMIELPSFLSATPNEAGLVTYDGDGKPIVLGTHSVKFTLTLPTGGSLANTPVVIYEHGINRTRIDMMTQVDTAAKHGMAVLATDIIYHGDRTATTKDEINDLTGVAMSDGFGDLEGLFPAVNFFHLTGGGGIAAYHPASMRDNLRQAAIDLCSLVAFVRDGDVTPINEALVAAGLTGDLSFRADGVASLSESFGSMISAVALAVEPDFDVASVSSIASGFPYPSMLHSANFSGTFADVILAPYAVSSRTILGDPLQGARYEPMVMFWNMALERGDPTAYAPYLFDGSVRGDAGPHLIVTESYADEWVPNEATEMFAGAAGLQTMALGAPDAPPDPALRFVALEEVSAPQSGNMAGGQTTAVHTLWHPAPHAVLRKIDDQVEYQSDQPPFPALEPPAPYATPTALIHQLWGGFVADFFDGGGAPTAIDPYGG